MTESLRISPTYGTIDKPYFPVSITCACNMSGNDGFSRLFNNTNIGGNSKWTWLVDDVTRKNYSQYGLSAAFDAVAGVAYNGVSLNTGAGYDSIRLNKNNSFMAGVSFRTNTIFSTVGDEWYDEFLLRMSDSSNSTLDASLVYSSVGGIPTMTTTLELDAAFGNFVSSCVIPINHQLYNELNNKNRNVHIAVAWSKELYDIDVNSLHLYINGWYIHSVPMDDMIDLRQFSSDLMYSAIHFRNSAVVLAKLGDSSIDNFSIMPFLLYGNGSVAYPYQMACSSSLSNTYKAFIPPAISNTFSGGFTGTAIYGINNFTYHLNNPLRSGLMPLVAIYPISGNSDTSTVFEVVMENRRHNDPFSKKPPVLMFDRSFNIGDNYTQTGAAYEMSGKEVVLGPTHVPGSMMSLDASHQPPAIISINMESIASVHSDSSTSTLPVVDSAGIWAVTGVSNSKESGVNSLTERSYSGVVCEYSSMGNANSDIGNGGWPVSCDRSPSSPLELYTDAPHGSSLTTVLETALRSVRFVGLNTTGKDRYKALFVGMKETAAINTSGGAWLNKFVGDLIIGRILNNDALDIRAPFSGPAGYRTIATNVFDSYIMYDAPRTIGTLPASSAFHQCPDIDIVPVGDPQTTRQHRIYWIGKRAGISAGLYNSELYYIDVDNDGETTIGTRTAVNLDYSTVHPNYLTSNYKMPIHFSIVQPEAGKFILVVTLGTHTAPNTDALYDSKLLTLIFTSSDGINFTKPTIMKTGALTPSLTTVSDYLYGAGWPKLTFTSQGENYGELLLSLTTFATSSTDKFRTYIFKSTLNAMKTSTNGSNHTSPWTAIIDCNALVHEKVSAITQAQTDVYGAAAFRDPVGKIHIAINKKPSWTLAPAPLDYFGGMYYAVLDDKNKSGKFTAMQTKDSALGTVGNTYDIVSMSRFTWDNKRPDNNATPTYDSYCCQLRPSFSPVGNDCYFTFNTNNDSSTTHTLKARDPIYRLFQPTDLGELYPPMVAWNYSMHVPAANTGASTYRPWLMSSGGSIPYCGGSGLRFDSTVILTKRFSFNLYYSWLPYLLRLPKETIAVKTRIRYSGSSIGLPVNINTGLFTIQFSNIVFSNQIGTPANYNYIPVLYASINADSIAFGVDVTLPLWSRTGIDFSVFRDLYIVGTYDSETNKSMWNIYLERVPNSASPLFRRDRWSPKSYMLLNETPIVGPVNSSGALPATESISFGGHNLALGVAWPVTNQAECKFFQIYYPLFKDINNAIFAMPSFAPIDGVRNNTSSLVSGAQRELSSRTRRYSHNQGNLCRAVFQIGGKSAFSDLCSGTRSNLTASNGSYRQSSWSIGNNSALQLNTPENIEFTPDRFEFKYLSLNGMDNAVDYNPRTTWICTDITSPARVAFDSSKFETPLSSLLVNSVWLLNTNLINARLKATTSATSWIAPFLTLNQKIDFSVDIGGVTHVPTGTAGVDDVLIIRDSTKNWTPNQFVDKDYPYYIIGTTAWKGGIIVRNTKDKIWYRQSTKRDGTKFAAFVIGDSFSITSPNKMIKLTSGVASQRWGLELLPNGAGDIQSYADGAAKIGEFGIGTCIELSDYGDVGFVETYKNTSEIAGKNDGNSSINISSGRTHREFDIAFSNMSSDNANKLIDAFAYCKTQNIPVWFAPTMYNTNDIMLCDFIDTELSVDHISDHQDSDDPFANRTLRFSMALRLRQRI